MREIPTSTLGQLLERGVWKAPWMGPHGEIVLLPVTSRHSLVTVSPITIPLGSDHIAACDQLWEMLDALDPLDARAADEHRRRVIQAVS